MTGYGSGSAQAEGLKVTVELRSVNNRFADLKLRLPEALFGVEQELRRKILATVKRGRIDVDIRIERDGAEAAPVVLNRPMVQAVLGAWRVLREEFGIHGNWDLPTMMRTPGILEAAEKGAPLSEGELETVVRALEVALDALDSDRAREGERLQADLSARIEVMARLTAAIRERAASVPEAIRGRLNERVQALAASIPLDPGRMAQEVAFLADRADVTEELVRLDGHLDHTRSLVSGADGEPVGKRLDFLLQEIHREINTIASKCQDLTIGRGTLDLKAEAEKVREQIQNLE